MFWLPDVHDDVKLCPSTLFFLIYLNTRLWLFIDYILSSSSYQQFNDQLISPKQFVHLAGKATLKDWKRAIRLGGVMLRYDCSEWLLSAALKHFRDTFLQHINMYKSLPALQCSSTLFLKKWTKQKKQKIKVSSFWEVH